MSTMASRGEPADKSTSTRRERWLGAGIIVASVLMIYWPALHGTWLWDDGYEVARNLSLRTLRGLGDIWAGRGALDYFPLKATLQWCAWHCWGDRVFGWHLLSVSLHALNALLVWRVLAQLGLRSAWLGGLLFGIHPLAVESVAWIAELKNTLSLAPALAAFGCFIAYDRTQQRRSLAGALLLFLAAMLCKSTVVMLPMALAFYLLWRHGAGAWRSGGGLVGFFAIALALGLVTVWFQHQRALGGVAVPVGTWDVRVARAGLALAFYVKQALWPVDLMPVYPRWPVDPPAAWQFLPWLGFVLVLAWLWRNRSGWGRHVLFGVGVLAANLAPILGFLAMAYMHATWVSDHFAYAALPAAAGLIALAVDGARTVWPASLRRTGQLIAIALCLSTAVLSRMHAAHFRSSRVLWEFAAAQNSASPLVLTNLGQAWFAGGRTADALACFARALEIDASHEGARTNLGLALLVLGQREGALRELGRAVADFPGDAVAWNALSSAKLDAGDWAGARQAAEHAVAAKPNLAEAHNNLGVACAQLREAGAARSHFEQALEIDPHLESARRNLDLLSRSSAGH